MVHVVVLLYTFQLENHILLYPHYISLLRIQWLFHFNIVHLIFCLIKEICNGVVDKMVLSLLVLA